jgi:acetyltransferase-like isoleucine patch superfamily enzyme
MWKRAVVAIKRADTPTTAALKAAAKAALRFEIPAPRVIFGPLYAAHVAAARVRMHASRVLYYQPMMRARCDEVGQGLFVYQGLPYIDGDLRLKFGDDCKVSAQTSLVAGHVFDEPTLEVGDHTNIGPGVVISVSQRVTLGSYVRVASGVTICDNPGHPMDALDRRTKAVSPEDVAPVVIEDDVWIASGARIMPGVTIGRGAVVAAGSIVTKDVEPGVLVAGAPARPVRRVDTPFGRDARKAS